MFSVQAQWAFDFGAERIYDDNVPRAQSAADIVSDSATRFSVAASRPLYAGSLTTLSAGAEARLVLYDKFHGLSHTAGGGSLSLRHKLGLGRSVPWLEARVSVVREAYREPLRDGDRFGAQLGGGWRLTDEFQASAGWRWDRFISRNDLPSVPGIDGTSFDAQGRSLYARAAYDATERLQLSLGVAVRRGDVVPSTRRNFDIFRASNGISPDPVFGSDYFTYRVSGATTRSAALGASWAIDDRSSISATLAGDRTTTRGGLEYDGRTAGIHYLYRH
jgi:hypothetical protein